MSQRPVYLYITPFFPREGLHYGSYSYDFIIELKRQSEYDVQVFVPGDGLDYVYKGIIVHTFVTHQLPSAIFPLLFARWNVYSFCQKLINLGIDIADVKVCHANTVQFAIYPLAIKKRNLSIKTLLHHHDLASCGLLLGKLRHNWLHKVIVWLGFRRLCEAMDIHIFISEVAKKSFLSFPDTSWSVCDDYVRLGRGIGWMRSAIIKQSMVLHNGVSDIFTPAGRGFNDGFVVGCCANYQKTKDFPTLIGALAIVRKFIPNLHIKFMGLPGSCPSDIALRRQIKELRLDDILEFLPAVDHSRLPDFYRSLDLFVMPSYFEGFGCVYTESWSCGTPFIGCEGQGIEDVINIEDRGLWLCKPRNVEDLARKILRFYRERPKQILLCDCAITRMLTKFISRLNVL